MANFGTRSATPFAKGEPMFTLTQAHVPRSLSHRFDRGAQPLRTIPKSARPGRTHLATQAIKREEMKRLATNILRTGLALRDRLPPSQLATATALTVVGTAYAQVGLPNLGVDPTLLAASTYTIYRARCTYVTPPQKVGLRAGIDGDGGHGLALECATLAALADGAARASSQTGLEAYALLAASLTPALWAAARTASVEGVGARYPALAKLESLPVQVGLGLLGTLAVTFAAERVGGAPAAVAMSFWANAQFFPQVQQD